jgi:hypothetical protein
VNGNAEVQTGGVLGIWRDLTTEPAWNYEVLPPLRLAELTELDLFEVSDTELARVHWFWSRRPKLTFHRSAALVVVGICVLLYVAFALVAWSRTSIPNLVAEMIILILYSAAALYLVGERIRFVRWRREYESSIDRLVGTIYPGCEGDSAMEC